MAYKLKPTDPATCPVVKARMRLLHRYPWWGALALPMRVRETDQITTAAVDGVHLMYNRKWFSALPPKQQDFVVAHEVEHVAFQHLWRIGDRDRTLSNIAADYVVNLDLADNGFEMPPDLYYDERFRGKNFEQVYAQLVSEGWLEKIKEKKLLIGNMEEPAGREDKRPAEGAGTQEGAAEGIGTQEGGGGGDDDEKEQEEQVVGLSPEEVRREWEQRTITITNTQAKAGQVPGHAERFIQESKHQPPSLAKLLSDYLTKPGGRSYSNRSRRFPLQEFYMPGRGKDHAGHVVVAVDTSGSIDDDLLGCFHETARQLAALPQKPERISVMDCDTEINSIQDFFPPNPLEFHPKGGGGTRFAPVFERIEKEQWQPDLLLYCTDLYNHDAPLDKVLAMQPPYPVIWVVTPNHGNYDNVGFGEIVPVDAQALDRGKASSHSQPGR